MNSNIKNNRSNQQKNKNITIISLFLLALTIGILSYFVYNYSKDNKEIIKEKNELEDLRVSYKAKINSLEAKLKDMEDIQYNSLIMEQTKNSKTTITQENSKINNIENQLIHDNIDIDNINTIKELKLKIISLEDRLKSINSGSLILNNSFEIISMEVGKWELSNSDIKNMMSFFSKEKSFYEILPIIDNKNYANDPDELKQLGLSRKRAELGINFLKGLNKDNKIFISTDIEVSNGDKRGFRINQYIYK